MGFSASHLPVMERKVLGARPQTRLRLIIFCPLCEAALKLEKLRRDPTHWQSRKYKITEAVS